MYNFGSVEDVKKWIDVFMQQMSNASIGDTTTVIQHGTEEAPPKYLLRALLTPWSIGQEMSVAGDFASAYERDNPLHWTGSLCRHLFFFFILVFF